PTRNTLRALAAEAAGKGKILGLTAERCETNMVTRLAWMAAKLVSSKRDTRY
ncbi:hypothetical protein B0H10DRAFT_2074362, partial [Mycena sp. CBHHK59/15]